MTDDVNELSIEKIQQNYLSEKGINENADMRIFFNSQYFGVIAKI